MKQRVTFTKVLLALGILLLLMVVGDLVARGFQREIADPVWLPPDRMSDSGRRVIEKYGCGGCHVIPGIRHATGRVGPQLTGFRDQMYIAGVLPNMPENLVDWLKDPRRFNPQTAMPDLNVTEEDAWLIAAYIYANP